MQVRRKTDITLSGYVTGNFLTLVFSVMFHVVVSAQSSRVAVGFRDGHNSCFSSWTVLGASSFMSIGGFRGVSVFRALTETIYLEFICFLPFYWLRYLDGLLFAGYYLCRLVLL